MSDQQPQPLLGGLIGGAIIKKAVDAALDQALDRIVKSPALSATKEDKQPMKEAIRKEVLDGVGPIVENMTNQEPLWRSKVLWTAIGTVATSCAGVYAMLTGDNRAVELVLMVGTIITGLGTIYSRIFVTRAIGR